MFQESFGGRVMDHLRVRAFASEIVQVGRAVAIERGGAMDRHGGSLLKKLLRALAGGRAWTTCERG